MYYELRDYKIANGREGDINDRFANLLPELFGRHHIDMLQSWNSLTGLGRSRFFYIVGYDSLDERMNKWDAFYADVRWKEIRSLSNGSSDILEGLDIHLLRSWSDLEFDLGGSVKAGVDEISFLAMPPGAREEAAETIRQVLLPGIRAAGGTVRLVADLIGGSDLPRVCLIVSWPTMESWRGYDHRAQQRQRGSVLAHRESVLLSP